MALTKVPSNLDATVATTQSASDNSTKVATTAYVTTAIANLVDGAPSTLNTLDEIAAALNDDAALNTTLTNSIATKLPLAGGTLTGNITVVGSEVRVQRPSGGSSYFGILMDSGEKVRLRNSYANKDIYYDRDGKLGINNSSPDELLHISGGGIKVDGEATIASGSGTGVFLDYASDVGRITALDQGTAWKTLRLNAAKLEFYIANGPQVEINSSGNLGVGVTNPQAPLSVQADTGATVARFIGRASDNIASMGFFNNAQSADSYIQSNSSWIRARADGGFHFRKDNTPIVTDVDGFTINGMNVGIGTADPGVKLDVAGEVRSTSQVGYRHVAHTIESGHSSAHSLQIGRWPSSGARWLMVPEDQGSPLYNREFGYNFTDQKWFVEGPFGVATTNAEGALHIQPGTFGGSYTPDGADQLILENNDSVAIDIRTPSGNSGVILFSDNDARGKGLIQYAHSNDHMYFNVDGSTTLELTDDHYLVAQGASQVRLVLGSTGNPTNNTSNWIRGSGSELDFNSAGNGYNWEIAGNKKMRLTSTGSLGINCQATAGHSFEVQDKSDGYSMFWTGRSSSGNGRGLVMNYGLLGFDSTQYDYDGAHYPVAGFAAAADNSSGESVDLWFGSSTGEWRPMVFMCIGAHTSGGLTGQTAGWALIRATHYNNGVSFNIMDSGGGGTWTTSVQGSYGADRANTSRCRIQYSSSQNRTVLSVWGANYSQFFGATRS